MPPSAALLFLAPAALALCACSSGTDDRALASALPGGAVLADAAIGAPIGGVPGAVWADRNGDGRVDGYIRKGGYYAGLPKGYAAPPPTASAEPSPAPASAPR